MANKVEKLNLYEVHVGGNLYAGQIEATSDEQALAAGAKAYGLPPGWPECKITDKNQVFEDIVAVECEETGGGSGSDVFEIRIRGVSEKKVSELARAICAFIGGPGMSESDRGKIHSAAPLAEAVDGMIAFV